MKTKKTMKTLKKTVAAILTLCIAMTFCGFGWFTKTVPDKMLDWEVQDFLEKAAGVYGTCSDYKTEVTHNSDRQTKTDTVTLKLTAVFPRFTAVSSYTATYEYNKATDLWTRIRGGSFTELQVTRMDISDRMTDWINAVQDAIPDMEYEDWNSITDYIKEMEVNPQRLAEVSSRIVKEWSFFGYAGANEFLVYSTQMDTEQAAKDMYALLSGQFSALRAPAAGDNYEYVLLDIYGYEMYILRCDNRFILMVFDGSIKEEANFYYALGEVGVYLNLN